MDIFDQILENLELERELGTRTVEIDRALLVPPPIPPPPAKDERRVEVPAAKPARAGGEACPQSAAAALDVAFVSGGRLSPAGMEMMEKIIAAVKKLRSGVSVGIVDAAGGVAGAKVALLLGSEASRTFNSGTSRIVRGRWITVDDVPALPTFSPDYILSHFDAGSAGMNAAKRELWGAVKLALARLA